MRCLVLGADGQVGAEVCAVLGTFCEVCPATIHDFDISNASQLRNCLDRNIPDAIVNAAAYTDVDGSETHPEAAMAVNTVAVGVLGEECRKRRVALLHYSTDFVFDGTKQQAYVETDLANPLNAYGRSKLAGEQVLSSAQIPAIVLRTAWVYSVGDRSFVSTILRLARQREMLSVVTDQVGSPTYARDLAMATGLLLFEARECPYRRFLEKRGVYHVAGQGACSRFELAKAAIAMDPRKHEHRVARVEPVASASLSSPAARPHNASLCCTKAKEIFGIELAPWQDALRRALQAARTAY